MGLIGFNGTFPGQVKFKTLPGFAFSNAKPGPHGGTAACYRRTPDVVCQWATGTTIGVIAVLSASPAYSAESLKNVEALMIKIRKSAERPA